MPLAQIKELEGNNSGIYVISPESPDDQKRNFKIGRTINMRKRLNNFHICFNEGYYIYAVLPLADKYTQRTKDEKKLAIEATSHIEKSVFEVLKKYNKTYSTRSKKSEWYYATKAEVVRVLEMIHKTLPTHTKPPIIEWTDDYLHEFEIDGFTIDVAGAIVQTEPLTGMVKDGYTTRSGRKVKAKKHTDMYYLNDNTGKPKNLWQSHVANYKKSHPELNHKQAMKGASATYNPFGNLR
jgi:hypothetical protein